MSCTSSQRQEVCGVVVNEKPNVRRCDYDQLKAILRNCVKHGPASQNRQTSSLFQATFAGTYCSFVTTTCQPWGEATQDI
jgi:hypothetical protein